MGIKYECDFCGSNVGEEHKIACVKCHGLLLRLINAYETKVEAHALPDKDKKIKKKRGRPKKNSKIGTKTELSGEKKSAEKKPEAKEEAVDEIALLTKCATCKFGFVDMGTNGIACTEQKDPKTCGK